MKKIFILMIVLMLILTSFGKYNITISEKKRRNSWFNNDGFYK